MAKTVVLMANDRPGLEVCRYLRANGDTIARLYVHEPEHQKYGDEIIRARESRRGRVPGAAPQGPPTRRPNGRAPAGLHHHGLLGVPHHPGGHRRGDAEHRQLPPRDVAGQPRLVPTRPQPPRRIAHGGDAARRRCERGHRPHLAQRPVPLRALDTAYTIYNRLQDEIVALFRETWPKIAAGQIVPTPQDESRAVYHKKSEIGKLDKLDLNAVMRVGDVINLLRARAFGDRGFAYYEQDGQRVYVKLCLSDTTSFQAASSARAA